MTDSERLERLEKRLDGIHCLLVCMAELMTGKKPVINGMTNKLEEFRLVWEDAEGRISQAEQVIKHFLPSLSHFR